MRRVDGRMADGLDGDVRVVLPLYGAMGKTWRDQLADEAEFYVNLAWRSQYCGVKSLVKDGVTVEKLAWMLASL